MTGINKVVIAAEDTALVSHVALAWANVFDVPRHPIPGGIAINTGAAPVVVLRRDALARQLAGVELPATSTAAEGEGAAKGEGVAERAGAVGAAAPAGAAFAAIYLSCNDLQVAAAVLQAGGVHPVALPDGSLALSPAESHGIALIFK